MLTDFLIEITSNMSKMMVLWLNSYSDAQNNFSHSLVISRGRSNIQKRIGALDLHEYVIYDRVKLIDHGESAFCLRVRVVVVNFVAVAAWNQRCRTTPYIMIVN
jgi:hypothetical protein